MNNIKTVELDPTIIVKEVDKSLLLEGFAFGREDKERLVAWFGPLPRGTTKDISILFNGKLFRVRLGNRDFDKSKFDGHAEQYQIRYIAPFDFREELRRIFYVTHRYIENAYRSRDPGDRSRVIVPSCKRAFLIIKRTENIDRWEAIPKLPSMVSEHKLIARQEKFEAWFKRNVQNQKWDKYFKELGNTSFYRIRHHEAPQSLPDGTKIDQIISPELYPVVSAYEYVDPCDIISLWGDCERKRFADDGSLKAALGFYTLYLRLRNPYRWSKVSALVGDNGRIKGMLEDKNFNYKDELEKTMKKVEARQIIVYGAPGTGKSFFFKGETKDNQVIRTTFHPDSDYSTFVGAYKPTTKEGKISYDFTAQAFLKAYLQAWKYKVEGDATTGYKPVFLIVEEINRGNCAQIFGDLFQLLDRGEEGFSDYPVDPDSDLGKRVGEALSGLDFNSPEEKERIDNLFDEPVIDSVLKGTKLVLPDNLYIWATMNTSDQSLFPIDSAFKRRWDWKYVPISKPDEAGFKDRKIKVGDMLFDWWDFITIVNKHISDITKSEDKQLGYFFVKAPDETGYITAERFANKVLFYLYNDVFKDWDLPVKIFGKSGSASDKYAFRDFFYDKKVEDVDGTIHKPGDIRSDEIVKFIRGLAFGDQKVAESSVSSESSTTT